ncbi:MAG: aspartate--tRNA(Asn) ligase [Bdellovibrionales bacterium]|nr:aspartate--tRNA(Asn) ligase [Bdellovibrionales bacterium]
MKRTFVERAGDMIGKEIRLVGWVFRYRALAKTVFIVLRDCTGTVQIVASPEQVASLGIKLDDVVDIRGRVRAEPRSKSGFEIDLMEAIITNASSHDLPFNSSSDISQVGIEVVLDHRPLSIRTDSVQEIFQVQASILEGFRSYLRKNRFTEIVTSKIVASGTEGGTNLFQIKYFERTAYLAQSPQFYKEHGVAAFERVFETAHVYRAEPHATSRHLTEYYSLDLEMGFIDGPEDVMTLERNLLSEIFEDLNKRFGDSIKKRSGDFLPDMTKTPTWEFAECMERLKKSFGRTDLVDDLDPQGERQLCEIAQKEFGNPSVFVIGFPLNARPFYTHPRGDKGAAQSFDLLFRGLEITTGGQRLHTRAALEQALRAKGMDPKAFEGHLRMFDLGMPPHGGLAIGLERLTGQVLGLTNVREATMYPRDRNRVEP